MNRDVVLATLALALCGAGVWLMSWLPARPSGVDASAHIGGLTLERGAWRRLWLPLLPAAVALATLVGWAWQEPGETDELLNPVVMLLVLPLGIVWLRAATRAVLALRRPRPLPPLATFGLLRPHIVIAEGLDAALDPAAFEAALAHERAHARHHDPLRIWLAQLVTDAQWPSPHARARFERWLTALELARDDEARRAGSRGADLAAAVVAVAGLARGATGRAVACLTGAELALAARVRRLLGPLPGERQPIALLGPLLAVAFAASLAVGVEFGDSLLRALPFIHT